MTTRRHRTAQSGFSLVEVMFLMAVMGILAGMAVVQMNATRPVLQGDAAMRVVLSQFNQARELAITQRRNMRLSLSSDGNQVRIIREEVPGPTLKELSSVILEGGAKFSKVAGLPDTPDTFGDSAGVWFAGATEIKFNPEGRLINQSGALLNGTVFVSQGNQKLSARAVTVLGSTGRVRGYRWDGRGWKLV
jgi:prepilin-type N-terminal cleavage/methylation domain-containing protein